MIFSSHSTEYSIGKVVFLPEKYPFCIAGYFLDAGLVFCREYFHAKKNMAVQTPWVIYQHWIHGFGLYCLICGKSTCRCGNGDDDRYTNSHYAHDGSFVVDLKGGNLNDTAKEPGTPVPERDKRIPIGPTDV